MVNLNSLELQMIMVKNSRTLGRGRSTWRRRLPVKMVEMMVVDGG